MSELERELFKYKILNNSENKSDTIIIEIKSYIQSIIIIVMILLYFRHIILENPNNFLKNSNKKRKKYYNIQERFISHPVISHPVISHPVISHPVISQSTYNRRESFNNSNNMRFLH